MRVTRVFLTIISIGLAIGFYQLFAFLVRGLEAQTLQGTEESMVDTAHLLANYVENGGDLEVVFDGVEERKVRARIFNLEKGAVGANVYLTDKDGVVVFDSGQSERLGRNYSAWTDVAKGLRGEEGARSTRADEKRADSSILYVGVPVRIAGEVEGVLTVYKAQKDVLPFVAERRRAITWAVISIGGGVIALILMVFAWLFRPLGKLTGYAREITQGGRPSPPKVGLGREVNTLAKALQEMRQSLEGRESVDRYVQTLAHELKSPLAAIQGAAELLQEEMGAEDRKRFLAHISGQTARSEDLIHRLLQLSAIESQTHLEEETGIDFKGLVAGCLDKLSAASEAQGIKFDSQLGDSIRVRGNAALLESAVDNLLENALHFSAQGTVVEVRVEPKDGVRFRVLNQGEPIPDFVAERAFERFFSYRPDQRGNGNGLGLTFVRETAALHGGEAFIGPAEDGRTEAGFTLPAKRRLPD